MKAEELRRFVYHYQELQKIGRSLNRLYCASCNGELTTRQEARIKSLRAKAEQYAEFNDLAVYHQTDPRGLSLYLVDKDLDKPDCNYSGQGIPVLE